MDVFKAHSTSPHVQVPGLLDMVPDVVLLAFNEVFLHVVLEKSLDHSLEGVFDMAGSL